MVQHESDGWGGGLSEPGSIPLRNWNLLPIPIQNPELELNWNCHHWNWN